LKECSPWPGTAAALFNRWQGSSVDWQLLGMTFGATFLGATGLHSLAALVHARHHVFKQRRHYAKCREAFNEQLTGALKLARACKPIFRAWTGERPFRVAAVVDEAAGFKSFYLVPADGKSLPPFEPGQYLTFSLPVDPQRKPIIRCYSLSDRPREDYYRVTIKLAQKGQGSDYFHHGIQVGSILAIQAPQGAFFLDPTDQLPIVLIAGGVGITPILSMANSIVHNRSGRAVYLFAGFRNSSEHPCREQLAVLVEQQNFRCDVSYSRPLPTDRIGHDYSHLGHVTIVRLRQLLPSNNFRFYVCGPPAMMEDLIPALYQWGVPEKHVHFEAFGPASIKGLNMKTHNTLCQVGFARAKSELTWKGEFTSLLDFATAEGIALDSGCRAGNCGACVSKVLEGKVSHTKTPGVPLAVDECLTCIGIPENDVVLDA
jgi:ferredoxin-NADP reductase